MKKLPLYNADNGAKLTRPELHQDISEDTSAMSVFTDFHLVSPLKVESSTPAHEVEKMMLSSHVRLKFVVDKDGEFIGVVSLDDLNGQTMMQKLTQGYDRDSLSVKDFMRRRDQLKAFSYEDLARSSIRDVVNTLESSGMQHCLVVDQSNNEIRGIISASDIARKLKLPINIGRRSNFSEIFKAVYH